MKKTLWVQMLLWIAAVVTALLLALALPDSQGDEYNIPAGAAVPR